MRNRSTNKLVSECAAAINRALSSNLAKTKTGVFVPFQLMQRFLDNDPALTRRVLHAARFRPLKGGEIWSNHRRPRWSLAELMTLDDLVDFVDFHRPV